jgi:hypothetical protein
MHIVVDIDGVLRGHTNDEPILSGIQMIGALSSWNKVTFITDMTQAEAEQWINVNKIFEYDNMIDSSVGLVGENLKERQLKLARSRGAVELFITSDPSLWAFSFEQGIPSVMFGVPSYIRPEFRPDAPKRVRAWTEIEEAVKKQNTLRTQDSRLKRGEGIRFE